MTDDRREGVIPDSLTGEPTTLTPCWFCGRGFTDDYLIAGHDTWDEQRLACLDCDRAIHALGEKGWIATPSPQPTDLRAYGADPPDKRPVLFWKGASTANEGQLLAGILVSPAELAASPASGVAPVTVPWSKPWLAENLPYAIKDVTYGGGETLGNAWEDARDLIDALARRLTEQEADRG